MPNLNRVMLMGNLTRDPEIKYTPKGMAIAELGMAINRRYTDQATGEKRDETTFVDVTLWGRQAEIAKEYLGKGKPVYIEGRLTLDTWDDKTTGQKRSKLKITGENMQLLGARGEASDDGGGGGGGSRSSYSSGGNNGGGGDEYDQRPSRPAPQPARGNSGGGGGQGAKPKPAPASSYSDEDDDIPF